MGRAPCCNKSELKKGPWTSEEDQKLMDYIQKHGHGSWRSLPKNAGLSRCGKSCRLRWMNYLRPDIKRGRFSFEEEETIIQLHRLLGNKWSAIAARLPGRTDTEIKNYWNTHIRKRLLRMGIDPTTHGPCINLPENSLLFSQTLYNPTQLLVSRLLGLKPLLHSKLLAMATNLISSQYQHSNLSPQNLQELHFNSPQTQHPFPCIQNNEVQNPIQEIPSVLNAQFLDVTNPWQDNMTLCDFVQDVELESFDHQIPTNSDLHVDNDQSFLPSVLSTLALSPSQSNFSSTYINSSTEEKGEGDCSEAFDIQIPELFDVTEFM